MSDGLLQEPRESTEIEPGECAAPGEEFTLTRRRNWETKLGATDSLRLHFKTSGAGEIGEGDPKILRLRDGRGCGELGGFAVVNYYGMRGRVRKRRNNGERDQYEARERQSKCFHKRVAGNSQTSTEKASLAHPLGWNERF